MSSKNMEPKLTLQNLADHLQKWKRPYLTEVKQTANEFHQKVEDHRKILIENNLQQIPYSYTNPQKQKITKIKSVQKEHKTNKKLRTQQLTQPQIIVLEPKLQEWKSDNQYRFKDLEQVIKNYDQVFKKKHKVKKNKKEQNIQDFRTDERYMIQQIYEELKNKKQLTVSFQAIQQFFENYELFYYFYNIHPYRLISLLKQSAKKFQDRLTRHEFIDFFLIDRPTISQFRSSTQQNIYNRSILSQQIWKQLKNIFDTLDTFGNEKISIKAFFQRIKNNPSSISILSAQAIQFPDIERIYTLQKILFDLQNKMQFDTKVQWQVIEDLIKNFTHIQEPTIDIIFTKNIQKANINKQSNYILLEPKIIDMVKQIFDRCPKCCDCFVKTSFFCVELLEIGIMKQYLKTPTQLQNSTKNIYLSLEQVIRKMNKQAPKYIDMDEMLEFLSIKGYQNQKKFVELYNKIQTESEESQSETFEQKNERRLKKIRSYQQLKRQNKKDKKKILHNKVTEVKQFKLHKKQQPTIRQKRVQEMVKQKQMEQQIELNKKFKANPIPVTLNPERYERYTRILEKKKQSILNRLSIRREKDQNLIDYLKTNTKLFQQKKIKPYPPQPYEDYIFEPTPIPIHISQQLLPKIQAEKQERRRKKLEQNRKKYNEVYWKNIRESSVDKDESLLQKINLIEQKMKFEQIRAKQVPNFQQLHRKFEQQLENRKQVFSPTRIQQFKLSSPAHRNRKSQYSSPQSYQFKSKSPPKTDFQVDIKSTKKYDDWVAKNQTRIAQKQLQQLKKQKEQEQRYLRQKNFAKLMRKNLSKCTDNTQLLKHKSQEKLKNFRNYVLKLQERTEQQLAQIYVRVLQRPFLFQDAGATRKPKTKQRPKKVQVFKASPEHQQSHPYKQGLFEKQGDQFHPIESENLNQSF